MRWLLIACWVAGAGAAPVLIVHDPRTPAEGEPMKALAKGWKRMGVEAVLLDQRQFLERGVSGAGAVVNYIHHEFDPAVEEAMIRYTEGGGRLLVLHHGMASGKMKSARWPGFMGVRILPRDDPQRPWKVLRGRFHLVNLQPGHYITTNKVKYGGDVGYAPSDAPAADQWLPELVFEDTEIFQNQLFTDGRQKVVLFGMKGESVDGKLIEQDRGGWLKRHGKGWIVYFQPGHFGRDFEHPGYLQVLTNALEWRP